MYIPEAPFRPVCVYRCQPLLCPRFLGLLRACLRLRASVLSPSAGTGPRMRNGAKCKNGPRMRNSAKTMQRRYLYRKRQCLCLSLCLSVCLPVCLSVCLSVRLSVCPSVCLCLTLCLYICACPSVCLSLSVPLSVSAYVYQPSALTRPPRRYKWGHRRESD
jgi:hypothetical protein